MADFHMLADRTQYGRLPATHAILPMKDLATAKSRLAPQLTPDERQALALEMLRRVLAVLCDAANGATSAPLRAVWVVSGEPLVLELAAQYGASPLADTSGDLNAALALARQAAAHAGAEAVLVVPADVPLITQADVTALAAALHRTGDYPGRVVLAPDRRERGTNALGLTLPTRFPFQFGARSLEQHIENARRLELALHIYRSPTLALDIDTPEDIHEAEQMIAHERSEVYGKHWLFRSP
jgi:2-phospho-L-lactate guanylyltransferase